MLLTVDDYLRLPVVPAACRLAYGPAPDQYGDLYLPASPGPHPVVIVLHGGCWRASSGLAPLGGLCTAFTQEGLAVWNLEYRRLGNGGGWPHTFTDVARGAAFLQSIAVQHPLDIARVVAVGHSAGGHLALWLAGRHHLPANSPLSVAEAVRVHGVVSLAGIPDLTEGVRRQICRGACHELVGGLPDEVPERYQHASPRALLPLGIPQWHLVGVDDPLVPADYIQQYIAVARQHNEVHLDLVPDAGHFELVVPTTAAWPAVRHAVRTLVARG